MIRSISRTMWSAVAAVSLAMPGIALAQAGKPIVGILPYSNGAVPEAQWGGLEKGIQDLLITDIASSQKVRVVERTHLDEILREQNLTRTGQVDPQTQVQLGKLLGACYMVTGAITLVPGNPAALTGRMVNVTTGQVDPRTVK